MGPDKITGEQLALVGGSIEAILKLKRQSGHVGESMKMTEGARDMLVEKLVEGRYILRVEADKRL